MTALTEQFRHGAEQAWASLTDGWRELRTRASGALTRFRHGDEPAGERSPDRFATGGWGLMAADIRVDDDVVVVRIEAPGMKREDLQIDVSADRLSVSGEKRFDAESNIGNYRLVQCAYGSFRRDVVLPLPVDAAHARADYRDGVLRIEMPRLTRGTGRRIAVRGESS